MSKWFSKPAECSIELLNTPLNNKYSPINRIVYTRISVKFLEDVDNIAFIRCGLEGTTNMLFYTTDLTYGALYGPTNRRMISQDSSFFNCYVDFPLDCSCNDANNNVNGQNDSTTPTESTKTYSFSQGEKLGGDYEFDFPNGVYLPSSYSNFGNINGEVSIFYKVFVHVYRVGGLITKKPKIYTSFTIPILYQSGQDPLANRIDQTLNYDQSMIFDNKVKKFYYDQETNALIPTSMNKNHKKTKFIRKLWNNDYKNENYNNMTKSLPLSVDFSVRSVFNLHEPFSSQFVLTLLTDLNSVGIESNQSTDFVFNGQSTNLGLFQIESLLVEAVYNSIVRCYEYVFKIHEESTLLKIKFKDLKFDVKDFQYDKFNQMYKMEIPIEELTKCSDTNLNKSLMDMLGEDTVLCNGNIADWLDGTTSLRFTWKISDGMSQKKKIEFKTSSTPDFLIGIVSTGRSGDLNTFSPPPPAYDNSKDDQKIES